MELVPGETSDFLAKRARFPSQWFLESQTLAIDCFQNRSRYQMAMFPMEWELRIKEAYQAF